MKLIIAGSRHFHWRASDIDRAIMGARIKRSEIRRVVCGGAPGIDLAGASWAAMSCVPVQVFKADWEKHGKAAGPIRNRQMAEYGDTLLLIWDGKSRGSASMKSEMEELGKPVFEVIVEADKTLGA